MKVGSVESRKENKRCSRSLSTDDWHLVLERARKAGVEKLIITGTNLEEAKEAIDVIKQHNESKYILGDRLKENGCM